MRVKRKLNTNVADLIKGLTSRELIERCPDQRRVFPNTPCTNLDCEFAIRESGYMNCTFVASEAGGHTLEAIGEMMGITREGVRLIEMKAKRAFQKGWEALGHDRTVHQQMLAPGDRHVHADPGGDEFTNEMDVLSTLYGGELDEWAG